MAKARAPRCNLSRNLSFLVLLSCRGSTLPADTHSLSCNVIVKTHTTPPQPWCEGQCSVDGEPFLQYDNDNKATPLGDLGKAAHASQVWKDFIQGLEYLGQELRKMLADTNLGTTKIRGHPTLQTVMLSQLEQGQIVGASLLFNISGKYSFTLNTMNMSWIPISLEAGGIMNKWTDDEELTKCLKISMATLSHWLKEFLKLLMERTRSTSMAPDITQLQSTTQLLSSTKFQYEEVFIPLGLISILIAFVFCIYMYVKRKSQGEARRSHWIPWNWSYRWLEIQGTERRSSPRVPSALNC
ncbi:retinoic acid early-inducible protein 1-epsilon-like [Onychomys torridus]|uniref:retinoic acid early-inducible protein 1-epsilon-like n=1 Tax=Onychomys torridus TaxID=38674 RepID=UPI00167F8021|nr:retinoic acid early-inducible protein 1-epsilon-like [Onychomys torridus]XP_036024782.1 retinoic acid early-inducible protein 1-epsilon-like [Onychomys torridus]XP_036024784.1 retinoic acid early-inducible protein 1-epsilon-like [Onychomys torridus]XP_036024785.1 retinoic acid early-inducible protein 1-epsilon-like [Onychomys torridus]